MRWEYETLEQYSIRMSGWHDWFAWYPVFEKGKGAWLCTIKRKAQTFDLPYEQIVMHWEYKI